MFNEDDHPKIRINSKANVAIVDRIYAYNNYGSYSGNFVQTNKNYVSICFWYVDRDVEITGKDAGSTRYSILLKKGWNSVYVRHSSDNEPGEISTRPLDNAVKWYFSEID